MTYVNTLCCKYHFLSKIRNPSYWTRLHLIHYWNVLSEVGYDAAEAYLSTVAKIKADKCHKVKKRNTLSGTVSRCGSVVHFAGL